MISYTQKIITDQTMSGTAVVNSDALWIGTTLGFAIRASWSGTPVGTIKLQSSCSPLRPNTLQADVPVVIADSEWTDIADADYSVSSAGDYTWNFNGAFFPWVRVVYTNASGTGVLNAIGNVKSDEVIG